MSKKVLRRKKLIEGRKPNFHISSFIAESTGGKSVYIKHLKVFIQLSFNKKNV
jgi:hypothetical protein